MNAIKHIIAVIAVYIRNLINAQHNAERVKFLQGAVDVKRERLVRENKRYTRWRGRAERAERRVRQQVDMLNARERRLLCVDSQLETEQKIAQRLYRENNALKARIAAILQYLNAVEKDRLTLAKKALKGRFREAKYGRAQWRIDELELDIIDLKNELEEKDEKINELQCENDDLGWAEQSSQEYLAALQEIKRILDDSDI